MLHKRDTLFSHCVWASRSLMVNACLQGFSLNCTVKLPNQATVVCLITLSGTARGKKVSPVSDPLCGGATFTMSTWTVSRLRLFSRDIYYKQACEMGTLTTGLYSPTSCCHTHRWLLTCDLHAVCQEVEVPFYNESIYIHSAFFQTLQIHK